MNCKCDRIYEIDGFVLDMGDNHTLMNIQNTFPMYDRFVPYLGKLAEMSLPSPDSWIVDIGANVGDTVAALIRHSTANILCVEPTNQFYALCKKNIAGFGEEFSSRVKLVKAYIGLNEEERFISSVDGGSAVKIKTDQTAEAPTYTIPSAIKKAGAEIANIALVKTDTDGYDAECIMSMGTALQGVSPFLFWENDFRTDEQLQKYLSLVTYLEMSGYNDFFIFDNFGNYLTNTDGDGLRAVQRYLGRMLHEQSTRTFFYVDVLACKAEKKHLCKSVITEYLQKIDNVVQVVPGDYCSEVVNFYLSDEKLEVTVRNCGSVEWTWDQQIKIGLFSENEDTGVRRSLPIEKPVCPGEKYTFVFLREEYRQYEEKGFGVRMLQEGVSYWGEYRQIVNSQ